MRRLLLLLCVALGGPQTAVAAEDYTKAVNAAWCAGAFAKSIKGLRASGKALDLKFARSVEALFNYNFAFAKGYFRENDALTSFILLGQQGWDECTRVTYRCASEYPATLRRLREADGPRQGQQRLHEGIPRLPPRECMFR